jgi:hypothetical protein
MMPATLMQWEEVLLVQAALTAPVATMQAAAAAALDVQVRRWSCTFLLQ